ncbi:MAG: right-handed parallel beta-helix repeat-containing protein [Lewinella sp.]|nr:right-handed parallel beta-helix repeat-containing protein [Lewinella sp.]
MKLRAIFPCFLLSLSLLGQTNYYISATSGNDANDGSLAAPWQTIHHALFNIPYAEDDAVIHLRAGTYVIPDPLFIEGARGGSAGQYFTLKAYNDGGGYEAVTIDGSQMLTYEAMLVIRNTEYVRIEGITFANLIGNDKSGLYINAGSDHVQIVNNTLTNMHWSTSGGAPTPTDNLNAFIVLGDDGVDAITDMTITGNMLHDITPGYSEALTVTGNVDGFLLEDNLVYDVANIGIVVAGNYAWVGVPASVNHARNGTLRGNVVHDCRSPGDISAGIYLDGAVDMLVENNTAYANNVGFSIGCEQSGSSTGHILRNNLAYDNTNAGLYLGSNNANGLVQDISVTGNTFFKNFSDGGYGGELVIQRVDQASFRNNIFHARNTVVLIASYPATNLDLQYNLYYNGNGGDGSAATFDWAAIDGQTYGSFATYQAGTGQDASPYSAFADPLFVQATLPTPDLHLDAGSPAFDAGDPAFDASGQTDLDGQARQLFTAVDMGADEADVVLPVTYLQPLRAQARADGILLTWHTGVEVAADRFQLQRSADAREWETIGTVPARGADRYHYLDEEPLPGVNYYRLATYDWNGQWAYSHSVYVYWTAEAPFRVAPNPARETLTLVGALDDIRTLLLYDQAGRLVGQAERAADFGRLPAGRYQLVVLTHTGVRWPLLLEVID